MQGSRGNNYAIKFDEVPNSKFARKSSETLMDHILFRQPTYRWAYQIIRTIETVIRALTHEHTLALQAATKSLSPWQSLPEVRAMYLPTGHLKDEVTSPQITNAEQVQ